MPVSIDVIKAGLETSVQDFPGRYGFWEQGFPPSGPFDMWSFRLANILVGNLPAAAGLECQFMGPTLRFSEDCLIALCGAEMNATLDGETIPQWESLAVAGGQILACGFAIVGARAYLAVSGGIEVPPVLGARATFHMAGVGGVEGHALKDGQTLAVGVGGGVLGRQVKDSCRPPIANGKEWEIEVVQGPNDDWIAEEGIERFLSSEWKLQARSNRTGYRLEGPEWIFAEKASAKGPEHGEHPSNILDHGYPVGSINLCGQTPIILVNDAPSAGGFINPFTVPSAAFWKLAQSKPNDIYRFRRVSVEEAQDMRRAIDKLCTEDSIA
ncbi:MAG TPA: biotin-dependent carboxyltransferase [Alphaproteobacteria bacterium]|nr:biotin-dependent carboxyltransferase [Alphaproteobacteria bacterium]